MSFPHTGGTANKKALGERTTRVSGCDRWPKQQHWHSCVFVCLIQRPEDGPAGLSGAAQRSPTVCRIFNGSVGNGSLCAEKFAKLLLWSNDHDCGLEQSGWEAVSDCGDVCRRVYAVAVCMESVLQNHRPAQNPPLPPPSLHSGIWRPTETPEDALLQK